MIGRKASYVKGKILLHAWGRGRSTHWIWGRVIARASQGTLKYRKFSCCFQGVKPQCCDHPAYCVVTILTTLSWLFTNKYLERVILTYLLTYSMVQRPSWEANWFAASREIPRILWNPKVHYCTHKCPPLKGSYSQKMPKQFSVALFACPQKNSYSVWGLSDTSSSLLLLWLQT